MNSKSALLVIDAQEALLRGSYLEEEVLKAIETTALKVRREGGLVIYIQHCHSRWDPMKKGNPGWELHQSLNVRGEDIRVEKEASDSFYESELEQVLQKAGIGHVYITGLQTEFCVDATCRSALSKGYEVTLISDGHTTGDAVIPASKMIEHHNYVLANLAHPTRSIRVCNSQDL